ncbi:uncharacterized protein F5147DRAFT_780105 [Suillus discolor]|uniref:WD40 repeat-like protein n=1 Tax=Suillus discolor TaxID=1912936 RepID=A0A9P7EUN2_9AGAM|nr:uncharacterized protein F5147DRAFT_780105 [Suillus discolor]KAG2091230.1 hypothetical protein F5147DRAFT_780105 [Suillus discolor]
MDITALTPWDGLGDADPVDAVVRKERDEDEGMGNEEEDEDEGSGEGTGDVIDFIGDDSVDWTSMPMNIDGIEAQGLSHLLIPITSAALSSSSTSIITPISHITPQHGILPRSAHLAPFSTRRTCYYTIVSARAHIVATGLSKHIVRSVALGEEFAVSGSYDLTIKVWDRKTGALVADMRKDILYCFVQGDQRICIWDFSHGIDTSFIKL